MRKLCTCGNMRLMKTTCVSFNQEERELLKRHERPGLSMSQLVRDAVNEKYREKEQSLPEQPESSNNEVDEDKSALDQLFQATTAEGFQRFFKFGTRKNG